MTPDEIAVALAVRKKMASYYLQVAARKLGAKNPVHAVAIAVESGMVIPKDGA